MLQHLSPRAVGDFDMSAMRVCQGAWKPTRQVLIYPLVVRGCLQNLNAGVFSGGQVPSQGVVANELVSDLHKSLLRGQGQ